MTLNYKNCTIRYGNYKMIRGTDDDAAISTRHGNDSDIIMKRAHVLVLILLLVCLRNCMRMIVITHLSSWKILTGMDHPYYVIKNGIPFDPVLHDDPSTWFGVQHDTCNHNNHNHNHTLAIIIITNKWRSTLLK